MKRYTMEEGLAPGLDVLGGTDRSQAATLDLAPYTKIENRHEKSDRWVYVLAGSGKAVVGDLDVKLAPGTLLLIEAGEPHEIENPGGEPMVLLNVYSPPPR